MKRKWILIGGLVAVHLLLHVFFIRVVQHHLIWNARARVQHVPSYYWIAFLTGRIPIGLAVAIRPAMMAQQAARPGTTNRSIVLRQAATAPRAEIIGRVLVSLRRRESSVQRKALP
jgi:hypothetical protein